jgi:predicted DsbA family dithiol-disulfide isomerase
MTVEELFKGRNVDMEEIRARLKQAAQHADLPLGERNNTYNSRRAQELGKWAELKGKGGEFHHAVFHAYFAAGQDISKKSVLVDLVESLGLSGKEAISVLESRAFRGPVDADWSCAREIGITAVPTLILNHEALIGAQPYHVMEQFMKICEVSKRDSVQQRL